MYKRGYDKEVSVERFKVALLHRRVSAMESHARRTAAKIVKVVKLSGEMDDILLGDLAKMHGVHKALIGYTVECARRLLA